jgi:hypothetical protein
MSDHAVILRVQAGSRAYGLNTDTSDDDTIEVFIETPYEMLEPGDRRPRSIVTIDPDVQHHPLGRYLHLALQGNPSVIESLYAPRLQTLTDSLLQDIGTELRALRGHIVSQAIRPRYLGYMQAQTQRLLGLRGGHSAGKQGRERYVSRDGYDTKYASHVLRLGYQCLELFDTGMLRLPMSGTDVRRATIMFCRNGDMPFDLWLKHTLALDKQIKAAESECLRDEPDREMIVEWAVSAYRAAWGWNGARYVDR